jgi:hypothetical protein
MVQVTASHPPRQSQLALLQHHPHPCNQLPLRQPPNPAGIRLPLPARQNHSLDPAPQPRRPQQIEHRRPHPSRIHHHRASTRQRPPPHQVPHPRHHRRIRRPQRNPLHQPYSIPPLPPPFIRHRIPLARGYLRPLHHCQCRVVPALSQVQSGEEPRPFRQNVRVHLRHPRPLSRLDRLEILERRVNQVPRKQRAFHIHELAQIFLPIP